MRRVALLVLLGACSSSAAAACAGLKSAQIVNVGPDGSASNGLGDGGETIDDAGNVTLPDGRVLQPPADFACDGDPWINGSKKQAECRPRSVVEVEATTTIMTSGVSIGRTPKGRIGIAFDTATDSTSSELHIVQWIPDSPAARPTAVIPLSAENFHAGAQARVIGTGPDSLNLLTFDYSDLDQTGAVNLARLDADEPLTAKEVVLDAVAAPSEIGFAIDSKGTVYAVIRVATSATNAKLVTRMKPPNAGWTTTTPIPEQGDGLVPKYGPGVGASSLVVDQNDVFHVLYNWQALPNDSAPRFHTFEATTWTYKKTVDNQTLDGLSGFSPRLAMSGDKKYALFYFRKGSQQAPQTADLRLATWTGDEAPSIEIIDQQIPAPDANDPHFRAAMAVDPFGLVHIAHVRPDPDNAHGELEYKRQTRANDGSVKWLSDIVDPDVVGTTLAYVDIVVDENVRPHIAYRSGVDGRVRYATRYDR